MTETPNGTLRKFAPSYRWDDVAYLPYKEEGSAPFKAISRQVLFARPELGCELRYFEMAPGGYSTLERHEHEHAVIILRGTGQALVGNTVHDVATHDLVTIPAWSWHQFRAASENPLGFLCIVNATRDRPQLPTPADLATLRADPAVARFLAGQGLHVGGGRPGALPLDPAGA
jgi:quercetin dioxygenase-like cupin family protein